MIKCYDDCIKNIYSNKKIVIGLTGKTGSDAMYPNLDDLRNICKTVASEGVSAFLPTTMTLRNLNLKRLISMVFL